MAVSSSRRCKNKLVQPKQLKERKRELCEMFFGKYILFTSRFSTLRSSLSPAFGLSIAGQARIPRVLFACWGPYKDRNRGFGTDLQMAAWPKCLNPATRLCPAPGLCSESRVVSHLPLQASASFSYKFGVMSCVARFFLFLLYCVLRSFSTTESYDPQKYPPQHRYCFAN